MKTAVLAGCGAMSKGWLKALAETPSLSQGVRIVGLADLDPGNAKARAAEFGLDDAVTGTDLDALLAQTRPDLLFDLVIPAARRDVVAAGLKHGCHVLSEKPMATSMEEARHLLALARHAGRIHAIIQNRRFVAGVRRIRRFIESGVIGELTGLHCDFFLGAHFGGFREEMDHALLLDMAIHTFDAARFMAGKTPLAVYCHETNPRGSWYGHGAAANAIFEFADELVFTYRGSWVAEGANTSWDGAWRVVGTRGTLLWDGAEHFYAKVLSGGGAFINAVAPVEVPEAEDEAQTHGHASVIADFLSATEAGRAPETDSRDNIKSLAMVFGAIESAKARRRVEIAEG
jgi:predicted dehydrogenase